MPRPFESDPTVLGTSSLVPTKDGVVGLLHRVARELDILERSLVHGGESASIAAASRAVHLALVELSPSA